MSRLDIRTLGSLEVVLDGRRLGLGTLKQRALLSLLLINRGRTVSAERVVMALWGPDAPRQRRSDVWVYVSRIRKALEPAGNVITRVDGGYMLSIGDETVDASRFESLAEEGRKLVVADPPAASLVLSEALALWRGDAYAEFATEEFALAEARRLEEARVAALELRVQADLAWMDADRLIPEVESLVMLHPLRPIFTASLMLALYRRGRQSEALRAYGAFANRLGEETGLEPPAELQALEERILTDDPALKPANAAIPTRLPEPIASFIGRAAELIDVTNMLKDHRLVVLTGPGGVGKTTLALEAGRRLALQFDDTTFVDLTEAAGLEDVTPAVAGSLRVRAQGPDALDAIAARLGHRAVLAVLDNCEVLTSQAVASIVALLQRAPGLQVLATSRKVLDVPGAGVIRVVPMGTEPGGDGEALLRERTSELGHSLSGAELRGIVKRTDGLPLAVELAAAQLSTWSPAEVMGALDNPLETLARPERSGPERHRTMKASIAWSERLLPEASVELLARLSVFQSRFTLDAVAPVVGYGSLVESEVGQHLRRLIESSLVLVEAGEPSRYRLLEPVREYAKLRLDESGQADIVAHRHARFYLERLLVLGPTPMIASADTLQEVMDESGNLVQAIRWAVGAGDPQEAQKAAACAVPLLRASSNFSDALAMAEDALAVSTTPSRSRAQLLFVAAPLWLLTGDPEAWSGAIDDLTAIAGELADREVEAWAMMRQADARAVAGAEPDEVIDLHRQAVTAMRDAGSPYDVYAYHQLAWYLLWLPDRRREAESIGAAWLATTRDSKRAYEELVAREFDIWLALMAGEHAKAEAGWAFVAHGYRQHGAHREAAGLMTALAIASLQRGDVDEALRRINVGLLAKQETGAWTWIQTDHEIRACIRAAHGDLPEAAIDLLASIALSEEHGEIGLDAARAQIAIRILAYSDPRAAATIMGAVENVLEAPRWGVATALLQPAMDGVTGNAAEGVPALLGTEAFDAAWRSGLALDGAAAAALATEALRRLSDRVEA